jgi:hypothetical protein
MITTRFNMVEEFEEELDRDHTDVSRGIVRVTGHREMDSVGLRAHVTVVATYYLEGYGLVRLDRAVGYLQKDLPDAAPKGKPSNAGVLNMYQEVVDHITARVEALGLVVRPGVYEVTYNAS